MLHVVSGQFHVYGDFAYGASLLSLVFGFQSLHESCDDKFAAALCREESELDFGVVSRLLLEVSA